MTCVIRKDNIIVTDSLIFNGGPSGVSLEYSNKIKRNKFGSAIIIYCGLNFNGLINSEIEKLSNKIVNCELNNQDISIKTLDDQLIDYLNNLKQNSDFYLLIATKTNTYIIKTYLDSLELYSYTSKELAFFGSGAAYLTTVDLDKNITELLIDVINNVPSCNGPINYFDLNLLKDII